MQITIYTDGACDLHAENRPGGWAAILCATDERGNVLKKTVISGGQEMTTNNQMELTAVIEGLKRLQRPSDITMVTDSQYVIDIATGAKRAAKNRALWRKYFKFARIHNVTWRYVMGHSGNVYNERCDQLAVAERRKYALYRVETPQTFEPVDADIKVYLASTRNAWSACIMRGSNVETLSDVLSNNETYYEALLIGAIQILKKLSTDETIAVYITRANFVRSINEWIPRWIENDWIIYKPIKYKHHWQEILRLTQERTVKFEYDQLLRHHPLYERALHHAKGLVKNSKWGVEALQDFEPVDADIAVYLASTSLTKYSGSAWSACVLRGDNVETLGDVLLNNETYYEALLIGVIQILKKLSTDETIAVYITQPSLAASINERIPRWIEWIENDWITYNAEGEDMLVKYKHYWQEILGLTQERTVKFEYDQLLRHHPLYERAQHHAEGLVKNSKWVEASQAFEPVDADIEVYLTSTRNVWSVCILRGDNVETLGDVLSNNETYYETLLIGAIQILKKLSTDETIAVYITQRNFVRNINERILYWIENDWTTYNAEGEAIPVKYKHHWQELLGLTQERTVTFKYDQLLRHHPFYKRAQRHAKQLIKNSK